MVNTEVLYINKLDIPVQENTKLQQDKIDKVLEVTEEIESYLKEMLFIIEYGSENEAFLLCRKIDKYLPQADNELKTTTIPGSIHHVNCLHVFSTVVVYSH
jgi:hypothetical protein